MNLPGGLRLRFLTRDHVGRRRLRDLPLSRGRLYELIYNRALASQMASARLERTTVELTDGASRAVLRATGGELRDDATMVCLDWYGGPPRARDTEQGADPRRASSGA